MGVFGHLFLASKKRRREKGRGDGLVEVEVGDEVVS